MRLRAYIIWAISFGPDLGEIQWFWHFMCGTLWGVGRARSPSQHFSISSIGSPTSIPPSANAKEIRKLISLRGLSMNQDSHCILCNYSGQFFGAINYRCHIVPVKALTFPWPNTSKKFLFSNLASGVEKMKIVNAWTVDDFFIQSKGLFIVFHHHSLMSFFTLCLESKL